jgi:hypothetical protein
MPASSQFHTPTALPLAPSEYGTGSVPEPISHFGVQKHLLPSPEPKHGLFLPARTLVTIRSSLSGIVFDEHPIYISYRVSIYVHLFPHFHSSHYSFKPKYNSAISPRTCSLSNIHCVTFYTVVPSSPTYRRELVYPRSIKMLQMLT